MTPPQPPGQEVLGHYVLQRKLGEGAMGEVWLAHDKALDRDAAVKLLRNTGEPAGQRRIREFVHEARATAKLDHPNVVTIFDVGSIRGRVFIAMEYIARGSLSDELNKAGALPWREATQAVRDAAAGLQAAHEAGIIHRDIKPGNLMRAKRGIVKVVDFGLAKGGRDAESTMTAVGTILGSPAYMSPEQCKGETADARSDLYSLICTYYHLLTRQLPFGGESLTAVAYQHCHEPFPDIADRAEGLPDAARRILAKGSQKDPAKRYQTAVELLADLDALLHTPEVSHTFEGSRKARTTRAAGSASGTRRKAIWAAALGLVALVAIFVGPRLIRGKKPGTASGPINESPGPNGTLVARNARPGVSASPLVLPKEPGLFRELKGHTQHVDFVQFLPDSWHVVSSAIDGKTRLWNLTTGDSTEIAGTGAEVSEDGRWVFVAGHFYDAITGAKVDDFGQLSASLPGISPRRQLLFRQSRALIASFDVDAKAWLGVAHDGNLPRFSQDGRYSAAILGGASVVYDMQTRQVVATAEVATGMKYAVPLISPTGQLVLLTEIRGNRTTVALWDWQSGKRAILVDRQDIAISPEFSPDGKWVLIATKWPIASLVGWDITDPASPSKAWEQTSGGYAVDIAFTRNGKRILVAMSQVNLELIDADTGTSIPLGDIAGTGAAHIAISPDARLGAECRASDPVIKIWRLPDAVK